ncbi:MAG: hypothetical protein COA57_11925 [Flavobacteriales bacterium]|nr:MAG: hypothetical protein COA57_11925 [Flavobacteriales bacterium]
MKTKALLFLFGIIGLIALNSNAQVCTPDLQYTQAGVYPDTIQGLPDATVGIFYSQVLTIVAPVDTFIAGFGTIPVDSTALTGIDSLPPGLIYTCEPLSCSWPGGTSGCILISGTPTTAGVFDLQLNFIHYLGPPFGTFPETKDYNTITVNGAAGCSDLFISEYVEGSGNNKALEIYNPTMSSIDLSNYVLKRYGNGSATATETLNLSGMLASGDVVIITNGQVDSACVGGTGPACTGGYWSPPIDTALYSLGDLYGDTAFPDVMYFNGDDALTLETVSGTIVDIFGKIGEDPGAGWTDDAAAGYTDALGATPWTKDKTLIRKPSVQQGVATNPTAFNPTVEWDSLSVDTWSNLGFHTSSCVTCSLTVTTASTDETSAGANDGTASVSASNGTTPYTYNWSNGGTSATISNLAPATYTVTVTDANGCIATGSAVVNVGASCNLTAQINQWFEVSCNGGSDGSASALGSGGTQPYTYLWSNGSTTQGATGLFAGTISVTITDANSCTDTASQVITEPSALIASASATDETSAGTNDGTATVTASGGTSSYSYSWNNGGITAAISNLAPGTYTVTVTDANGCTSTDSVVVNAGAGCNLAITSVSITNPLCNSSSDGAASVGVSGGLTPYSYNWSNGGTSAIISNLSAGTYTVTVSDAGTCTVDTTITLTAPSAISLVTSTTDATCGNADGSATITATGGTSPYSYAWPSGGSGPIENGLVVGNYIVTVTDAIGCTQTASVTINDNSGMAVTITASTDVTCSGGSDGTATASTSGGTPSYVYAWSSGGFTATETGLSTGIYVVTATDNNGCSATNTVTIAEPPPIVIATGSTPDYCGSGIGSATVTATGGNGGFTYSWSNGSSGATQSNLSAGNYIVTATDANNCTVTATVTIAATQATASITGTSTICEEDTVTLTASGGTTYFWNTGATTNSITASPIVTTDYIVNVTDSNNCTATDTFTLTVNPMPVASFTLTKSGDTVNFTNTSTAGVFYLWDFDDNGATSSATDPQHIFSDTGSYTVSLIATNSCGSDTAIFTFNIWPTGIVDTEFDSKIQVYPNPSNGKFIIEIESIEKMKNAKLRIVNVLGQEVWVVDGKQLANGKNRIEIDLKNIAEGAYYLQFITTEKIISRKIVVE